MQSIVDTRTLQSRDDEAGPSLARPGRVGRVVGVYAIFILILLLLIEAQPRAGADVAVMAPMWSGPGRAAVIAAGADGDIIGATRFPFIIVAHARSSHFTARAYAQGAWLVFDAGLIAGCRLSGEAAAQD